MLSSLLHDACIHGCNSAHESYVWRGFRLKWYGIAANLFYSVFSRDFLCAMHPALYSVSVRLQQGCAACSFRCAICAVLGPHKMDGLGQSMKHYGKAGGDVSAVPKYCTSDSSLEMTASLENTARPVAVRSWNVGLFLRCSAMIIAYRRVGCCKLCLLDVRLSAVRTSDARRRGSKGVLE